MKKLFTFIFIISATTAFAQQYKIVVSYDDNGNRVKRERICYADCTGPKPAPPDTTAQQDPVAVADSAWLNSFGFEVYPNPTEGGFTLRIGSPDMLKQKCSIIVTDALGRELMRKEVTELITRYDIGYSADGFYMCTVIIGDHWETVRLVKGTK